MVRQSLGTSSYLKWWRDHQILTFEPLLQMYRSPFWFNGLEEIYSKVLWLWQRLFFTGINYGKSLYFSVILGRAPKINTNIDMYWPVSLLYFSLGLIPGVCCCQTTNTLWTLEIFWEVLIFYVTTHIECQDTQNDKP